MGTFDGYLWATHIPRAALATAALRSPPSQPGRPAPLNSGAPSTAGDGPATVGGTRAAPVYRHRRALKAVSCNIVGSDDRKEYHDHDSPWSQIGFLGSGCTAALIGKRTLLTAGESPCAAYVQQVVAPAAPVYRSEPLVVTSSVPLFQHLICR